MRCWFFALMDPDRWRVFALQYQNRRRRRWEKWIIREPGISLLFSAVFANSDMCRTRFSWARAKPVDPSESRRQSMPCPTDLWVSSRQPTDAVMAPVAQLMADGWKLKGVRRLPRLNPPRGAAHSGIQLGRRRFPQIKLKVRLIRCLAKKRD